METNAPIEVIDAPALESLTRGEIDVQITTARRYPRSLSKFVVDAKSLATLSPQVAESCYYNLRRGGKVIEGPSIRLAEIVAGSWGNLRVATRIIAVGEKFVTAQAVCHDLETNVAISSEVQRSITGKEGRRYSADMIITTANAARSIAMRNAIFQVVPRTHVDMIKDEAKRVALGDEKTLPQRRKDMLAYFKKEYKVPEAQVLASIRKRSIEDVGLDELGFLKGLATAIKDGTITPAEAFADPTKKKPETLADVTADITAEPEPGLAAETLPPEDVPTEQAPEPADADKVGLVKLLGVLLGKLKEQDAADLLSRAGVAGVDLGVLTMNDLNDLHIGIKEVQARA